jgi:hypothetical protein
MNRIGKTLLSLVALGLSFSARALTPDNRYETIIDRNIFRLNPMPPPPAPTNAADSTLNREVKLTGISNIGGTRNAWFMIPTKPPSKDPPLYLNLTAGEKADFIEVVSISEEEGEVKILHTGNAMTLSLKNDSLKANPVAATPVPAPVANVVPPPTPATPDANSPSYGRTATVVGGTPTSPVTASSTGQPGDGSGLRTIPTRTLRLAPVADKPVDPLTQRVMMEVQQEQAKKSGRQLPPIPPLPQ